MSADAFDQEAAEQEEAEVQRIVEEMALPTAVTLDFIVKNHPTRSELSVEYPDRAARALFVLRANRLLVGWGLRDEPLYATERGLRVHELVFGQKDKDHASS